MDRAEMLGKIRDLTAKIRANRASRETIEPVIGDRIEITRSVSPAERTPADQPANGEPTTVLKPPFTDGMVRPASAEQPVESVVDHPSISSSVPAPNPAELISKLEARIDALEAALKGVNEKLEWLYHHRHDHPAASGK